MTIFATNATKQKQKMKRSLVLLLYLIFAGFQLYAQNRDTLTFVYATSDDGFVNVRNAPNSKAPIIDRINMFNTVLSNGILLDEKKGNWVKVATWDGKKGWANSKYLKTFTCIFGEDDYILVATAPETTIYNSDGKKYCTIKEGTIIADAWFYKEGEYYVISDHSTIYIPISQAKIVRRNGRNSH